MESVGYSVDPMKEIQSGQDISNSLGWIKVKFGEMGWVFFNLFDRQGMYEGVQNYQL